MGDSWPVCPACGAKDSVRDVAPKERLPCLWNKKQAERLSKWLYCTECDQFVKEADLKFICSNDDEPVEPAGMTMRSWDDEQERAMRAEEERESIKDTMPDDEGDKS